MRKSIGPDLLRGNLLVGELLGPSPIRVATAAKELRRRGIAGAAFAEILALLRSRRRIEIQEAFQICHTLRSSDWYQMGRSTAQITPERIIEAAYWVSNYELEVYARRYDYDPARRIQELALVLTDIFRGVCNLQLLESASRTERHAFACLTHIRNGQISQAFQALYEGYQEDQSHIWVRRAANQLFYQIPRDERAELISYGASGIRTFGISPFHGHGLVLKEFTGFVDRIDPARTEFAPLPSVKVLPLGGNIQFKQLPESLWRQLIDSGELLVKAA